MINNAAETVVLASSRGIARVSLTLYLVAFVVVPAFCLPFNLSFVVWVAVAAAIGIGGYVRFSSMRLVSCSGLSSVGNELSAMLLA